MKLFHLSDLHIGKRVNEFSMLEDQKYILMQILKAAKEHQPDGIILAGDIYDKPVPAAEAVQVFDDFLTSLNEMGLIVFMISGNHDSPERVSYGGRLMKKSGIYVAPVYEGKTEKVEFTDAYGKVCIHLLPFVKPAVVRHAFEEGEFEKEAEAVCDYQSAVKMTVSHMAVDTDVRNVLIAHQFVTGAMRCESEEVSVGGLDNVDASVFDGFDYVALGHIHSPQAVGRDQVRYCGTPLKYSFSEAGQEKSITVVELKEKGKIIIGICGGLQMLGKKIYDPKHLESNILETEGFNFFDYETTFDEIKKTEQVMKKIEVTEGILKDFNDYEIKGYEIHQGVTNILTPIICKDNVFATYIHGIFD